MSDLIFFVALLVLPLMAIGQDPAERIHELEEQLIELERTKASIDDEMEELLLLQLHNDLFANGLPKLEEGEVLIDHSAMALVYDEEHEHAKWVAHIILPAIVNGQIGRTNDFREDPKVTTGTAVKADYWYSGYDRGHLAPSADFRWSKTALSESYFYSNMSPQLPEFNRQSWAALEDRLRRYVAFSREQVYVVSGAILTDDLPKMQNEERENEVSIPELYYKVVVDLEGDDKKGIAYLMKNGVNDHPVVSYAVPIDSIEALSGIDFFASLDPELQALLESDADYAKWDQDMDPFHGEVAPLKAPLPKGMFNTVQAKYQSGKTATVCGTVVSTKKTKKSNAIYLNLDRKYPNQLFYATIWNYNSMNFAYDPEHDLIDKKICVTGKVTVYDEVPRISVNNENEIELWETIVNE